MAGRRGPRSGRRRGRGTRRPRCGDRRRSRAARRRGAGDHGLRRARAGLAQPLLPVQRPHLRALREVQVEARGVKVRLGFRMGWHEDRKWRLARQLGLDTAMTAPWYRRNESGPQPWSFMPVLHSVQRFADFGFELLVVSPPPMDQIRLGTPEKEREYDDMFELIETMGALKIPVLCYNFNAVLHATRTSVTTKGRGGALVTSYDDRLMQHAPMTHVGKVDDELLWDNLHEFLERTVPVAEANNVKLALHPDDPPIPRLRGIARIIRSEDALKRVLDLVPSKANG